MNSLSKYGSQTAGSQKHGSQEDGCQKDGSQAANDDSQTDLGNTMKWTPAPKIQKKSALSITSFTTIGSTEDTVAFANY